MPTRIRFRLNKLTGEVEEFLVDDQDRTLSESEHDRIAAEVGRAIARNPELHEVLGPTAPPAEERREDEPGERQTERNTPQRQSGGGES